ncbi:MAG: protein kinase [Polyangiales bacterium]
MNAPITAPARAQEGSLVCGGFTLERLLRRDDVASVYLARAPGDGHPRHVARVAHGVRPADERRAAAFEEAAAVLLELRHRAVPRVVAVGVTGAEPVVVAERVHAATLRDRSRDAEGLDPQGLAVALLRVAEVLDWLHARGVVHRRLSPDNVLVSGAGEVWLEECGLAHALVEAGWSPTSVAPAAAEYLTPQEALHRIHPQTDVFALATVAYECLTGAVPFAGDAAVVRAAVLERERPSLVALRPDLSRNVDAVLLRAWSSEGCGALEPYPTAEALARELLRVLDASVRVTSPHSITLPPQRAATVPPLPPEDVAPAETPVRVHASLADLARDVAAPEGPREDDFVDAADVVERFSDPPPTAPPADVPPAEPERVTAPAEPERVTAPALTEPEPTAAASTEPASTEPASIAPAEPALAEPAPAEPAAEGPALTEPVVVTIPPSTPSSVQTQPGVGAAVSRPAAVASSPPADPPTEPPLVRVPARADEAAPRDPMPDPAPRTAIPSNLGPSLVAVAAIFAGAWVYTHRDPPPAPPPLEQRVAPLRAAEPAGEPIPEVRTPPAPPAPPAPVAAADAAPAPALVTPDASAPLAADATAQAAADASATPPPVVADAGAVAVARPPQGELDALRTILQGSVERCLEHSTVRAVRVAANYAGATGRPRVRIETPMEDIEAAACIEGAIIDLPVRRFGPGNWLVRYNFTVR